jgi:hypothetical protein
MQKKVVESELVRLSRHGGAELSKMKPAYLVAIVSIYSNTTSVAIIKDRSFESIKFPHKCLICCHFHTAPGYLFLGREKQPQPFLLSVMVVNLSLSSAPESGALRIDTISLPLSLLIVSANDTAL